jgi:hypothetical protein
MFWIKDIKSWFFPYILNLAGFIFGAAVSGVLIMVSPNAIMGVFYFAINVLVGAVVWASVHKKTFGESLIPTFVFYASLAVCGLLAVLLGDALLDYLRPRAITVYDVTQYAFFSLSASVVPCIILSTLLYVLIRDNVHEMISTAAFKYKKYERESRKHKKGNKKEKKPKEPKNFKNQRNPK